MIFFQVTFMPLVVLVHDRICNQEKKKDDEDPALLQNEFSVREVTPHQVRSNRKNGVNDNLEIRQFANPLECLVKSSIGVNEQMFHVVVDSSSPVDRRC